MGMACLAAEALTHCIRGGSHVALCFVAMCTISEAHEKCDDHDDEDARAKLQWLPALRPCGAPTSMPEAGRVDAWATAQHTIPRISA